LRRLTTTGSRRVPFPSPFPHPSRTSGRCRDCLDISGASELCTCRDSRPSGSGDLYSRAFEMRASSICNARSNTRAP
jgi:hypothetical protein